MKIARVYANFQTDLKYTEHYLARELAKEGHKTIFITSDKYLTSWEKYLKRKDRAGHYIFSDFEVYRLSAWFPMEKTIFKNWIKLYKLLFQSDFDIIHLNGVSNFSSLQVYILSIIKGKNAPPIIVSDHTDTRTHTREGVLANIYQYFRAFFLLFLQHKIKKIITFSNVGVEVLTKKFPLSDEKFEKIPLGYDQDNYKYLPGQKNKEGKMIIGFAGKISVQKRVDLIIKTVGESHLSNIIKILIAGMVEGDRYCESLRELSKKYNTEIEFKSLLSSTDLALFYNYIDLAVYPGGISITTIEANGCGTPILLYKSIDGLKSRVENGRGMLFETKEEFVEGLKFYDKKYLDGLINNTEIEKVTKEASSWSKIKNQYLKIYINEINSLNRNIS